jgi:ABC-type glutathione transport system ATPase component
MYLGRIVEIAGRDELYRDPLHPYTQALLAAIPIPDPELEAKRPQQVIAGEVRKRAQSASRLPLPPTLPDGRGALRRRRAAAAAGGVGQIGRLPSRGGELNRAGPGRQAHAACLKPGKAP